MATKGHHPLKKGLAPFHKKENLDGEMTTLALGNPHQLVGAVLPSFFPIINLPIMDDGLAILAILLGCTEGLEEIRKSRVLVPLLIDLLRYGSAKGKENSVTLLLGLCRDGGEEVARRLSLNPWSIPSLKRFSNDGSLKTRRKADALLRLLNRRGSHSRKRLAF